MDTFHFLQETSTHPTVDNRYIAKPFFLEHDRMKGVDDVTTHNYPESHQGHCRHHLSENMQEARNGGCNHRLARVLFGKLYGSPAQTDFDRNLSLLRSEMTLPQQMYLDVSLMNSAPSAGQSSVVNWARHAMDHVTDGILVEARCFRRYSHSSKAGWLRISYCRSRWKLKYGEAAMSYCF